MANKVKPPIFTLRGHDLGVTALSSCSVSENSHLVSGDEEGTVIIWNLITFRLLKKFFKVVTSRIQSLKVIRLIIGKESSSIVVLQSRDNGILLINLDKSLQESGSQPTVIETFSSAESLFSRCDAVNIDDSRAILAHPSSIEKHLVTVRILIDDAKTLISGTAQRNADKNKKNCNVFDIVIKKYVSCEYLLFVAYEDGCLSIFSFSPKNTTTVPVLNSEGLNVSLLKTINLEISDFVSAFDVVEKRDGQIDVICGSPLDKLAIAAGVLNSDVDVGEIPLKRPGTSAIAIRPDCRIFAAASWDTTVRIYSMKSLVHLANLKHHSKPVQSLLFIERPDSDLFPRDDSQATNSNKVEGSYLLCCASLEGTISISAIY